tara:strand:+ start:121 stop:1593 length:1473 start_codon:yes stop_codon:yes gene_type:complete
MVKKQIVVIGGGSAGWLAATFLNYVFNEEVTVIESSKIGILGVGEGTTPPIMPFLNNLNIDPIEIIKKCSGTLKAGISFENWNGDGKKYFHGFSNINQLQNFSLNPVFHQGCYSYYLKNIIHNNLDMNDYIYSTRISYKNKLDLKNTLYALHFDARKFAEFLKNTCLNRGVKLIDNEVVDFNLNDKGNIKSILFKDNQKINCDLVIDCSGFARIVIEKLYKTEWISYKKYLPLNKGIPFFDEKEDLFPYTKATCMKNGWMWQIPLQHRVGKGYVFNDAYISIDEAKLEVEKFLNKKIEINKIISFNPGRMKESWVKNCIAMGVSNNFTEPLEATSLWLTISQLDLLRQFANDLFSDNEDSKNLYNNITNSSIDDCMHFIWLHYQVNGQDSKFWIDYKKNQNIPPKFEETYNNIKNNNLRHYDLHTDRRTATWSLESLLQIAYGQKLFKKNIQLDYYKNLNPSINEYLMLMKNFENEFCVNNDQWTKNAVS